MEGTVLGDYRLLSQSGEGPAGIVFLTTPTKHNDFAQPGDPLAINVYKPETLSTGRR